MKKFKFKVTQIYSTYMTVQAESFEQARYVLDEQCKAKDVMMSEDDLEDTLFDLVEFDSESK